MRRRGRIERRWLKHLRISGWRAERSKPLAVWTLKMQALCCTSLSQKCVRSGGGGGGFKENKGRESLVQRATGRRWVCAFQPCSMSIFDCEEYCVMRGRESTASGRTVVPPEGKAFLLDFESWSFVFSLFFIRLRSPICFSASSALDCLQCSLLFSSLSTRFGLSLFPFPIASQSFATLRS